MFSAGAGIGAAVSLLTFNSPLLALRALRQRCDEKTRKLYCRSRAVGVRAIFDEKWMREFCLERGVCPCLLLGHTSQVLAAIELVSAKIAPRDRPRADSVGRSCGSASASQSFKRRARFHRQAVVFRAAGEFFEEAAGAGGGDVFENLDGTKVAQALAAGGWTEMCEQVAGPALHLERWIGIECRLQCVLGVVA